MSKQITWIWPFVLFGGIASLKLVGCVQSDVVGPNGYSMECDKSRECAVFMTDRVTGHQSCVVLPEVAQIGIQGHFIMGLVVQTTDGPVPPIPPGGKAQEPGYFILDTENGALQTGLSEAAWKGEVQRLGFADIKLQNTPYSPRKPQAPRAG